MSNRNLIPFFVVAAASLAGCNSSVQSVQPSTLETGSSPSSPTPSQATLEANGIDLVCATVRAPIIMRIDPAQTTCSTFSGFEELSGEWTPSVLFEQGSPMMEELSKDPSAKLPTNSPLREFCRYEYVGSDDALVDNYLAFMTQVRDRTNPPRGVFGQTAATDCPVIASAGEDQGLNTEATRNALHEAFMANIHAVDAEVLKSIDRSRTRLVLLDTIPENEDGATPSLNAHGRLLESLVTDIVCADNPATCEGLIEQVLVTPRRAADGYAVANWAIGGEVGYMHEFSVGLAYAVRRWHRDNSKLAADARSHLVVSAAVAADPNHPFAGDKDYAPGQSAIAALQVAHCLNVAVYSAAGNRRNHACPELDMGMLAPAVYEDEDTPTIEQCRKWGYGGGPEHGGTLLTAVGGVTGTDAWIPNHRMEGHPRLHATASDAISSSGDRPMTGTSVGTSVAAATHMLAWSVDRKRTAGDISSLIYEVGYDLDVDSDAGEWTGESLSSVHRLAVCPVLKALGVDVGCAASLAPDPKGNLGAYAVAVDAAVEVAKTQNVYREFVAPEGTEPACSLQQTATDAFVRPQPERPICSICTGRIDHHGSGVHALQMTIDWQSWSVNAEVTEATLYVYNAANQATSYSLEELSEGVIEEINNVPTHVISVKFEHAGPASATLEFIYDDDSEWSDSVTLVYP